MVKVPKLSYLGHPVEPLLSVAMSFGSVLYIFCRVLF